MKKFIAAALLLCGVARAQVAPTPVYGLDLKANNSQALSATGHGRIRYNSAQARFEQSLGGAAYTTFGGTTVSVLAPLGGDGSGGSPIDASAYCTLSGCVMTGELQLVAADILSSYTVNAGLPDPTTFPYAAWLSTTVPALVGAQVRNSPVFYFNSRAWNGSASKFNVWSVQNVATAGATTQGDLQFRAAPNGGVTLNLGVDFFGVGGIGAASIGLDLAHQLVFPNKTGTVAATNDAAGGDATGTLGALTVPGLALKAPLLSPAFTGSPTFPAGSIADAALASAPVKLGVANTWAKNQTITTFTLTDAATITVDLSERDSQRVTLGGNRTIALSNLVSGSAVMLELIQDGTGSRTVTWPAAIHWSGGTAPTLTTTAGQADIVSCKSFNGTTMLCTTNGNYAP